MTPEQRLADILAAMEVQRNQALNQVAELSALLSGKDRELKQALEKLAALEATTKDANA